jgi:hypothetical protein
MTLAGMPGNFSPRGIALDIADDALFIVNSGPLLYEFASLDFGAQTPKATIVAGALAVAVGP